MLSLVIAGITLVIVVYLLVKGYYPQAALFIGGLILLTCTWIFGLGDLLPAKQTTHFGGFDIFKVFSTRFATRIGGLGLMLMAIGGFSRYMEYVGASSALFKVFEKPLKKIKNPYLLLGAAFLVEQIMVIFVPSHAGLGLLLMCTLYPILVRSGVSPLSALGVIGCCQFMDVGPGSGNANMAAQVAQMDVSEYFVYYQLPLFIGLVVILTFVQMFVQAWWDKREGWHFDPEHVKTFAGEKSVKEPVDAPRIYAILPIIPLFLIIFFSKVAGSTIRMDVVTAMVISTIIAIIFELIRWRDLRKILGTFKLFFEGMGKILVGVVSLIICGEYFAQGLIKSGAMGTLISAANDAGFGLAAMVVIGGLLLWIMAFIMGSGNAAFFSFAPLVPPIAHAVGAPIVSLIFPLQVLVSFGRVSSPITAALIAISGIAGVSSFQVAKRTCIPMFVATIVTLVAYFMFWY
ncbi:C4-dicarboxylate transporter DcuC [Mesosutterella sp. OilRF-GAM-744-9]|uniref:C4-dicarboxylate transporter DcuC n=2 Tax=Mesosutterella TaxID=2494213 RepID=A0ABS9MQ02_9BURK|nr:MULTISPECIES: C4-dicarboxylate transporter DcuC [unclassified Mesosutterella]MCG5030674.1 C4-dicarboxylate transporter DcuC [Mesosutterella sp. oilRF-744-WT-GAM-9]MCI6529587.1 C4-dicarboxylate transporter DcuC [Mesosutterella sp.]MDL2060515.1 C4-dicarboxylate transporter DcuC [Mesosutterella sp. AGMB02718]